MAPPSPSEALPAPEPQKALPTPFLSKTYQLVDDSAVDDVVSWSSDGCAFVVWRPAEFARDLLPKYFKHNNFSSFVRQLNTYGFRKVVPDRWEFANDFFRRGEKRLLCDIHRRKITAASPPASAAPAAPTLPDESPPPPVVADLADENERLRRENVRLGRELSRMRALCDGILGLLSSYAGGSGVGAPTAAAAALELMPMRSDEEEGDDDEEAPDSDGSGGGSSGGARLFGVPIGAKRMRVVMDQSLDLTVMKREPLDHRIKDDEETCGPFDRRGCPMD